MPAPDCQRAAAEFLAALAGSAPIETHISLVYRGADTVWKLKKAVRLSFLDFSTLASREAYCRRELALNAPAAPGLYRDVVAIVRRADGTLALAEQPDGNETVLDWVLRMARVPEADFLDRIAERGGLTPDLLDAIADGVAAYHQALPPAPPPPDAMRRILEGNRQAALTAGLPACRVEAWAATLRIASAEREPWVAARAASGFIRRAHGDLHLGNLCLWQGRPVPFDALEFDEDLATIDLAYDLAFLLMDLDIRAGRAAANRVLNRYVARTGDAGLTAGLGVFLSLRAIIRAHVAARSDKPAEAETYLARAEAYAVPRKAAVIAIGGLPGTGKSTLARALAPALGRAPGALVLRSDEIRKRLCGVAPETRLGADAYAEAVSARVFAELAAEAASSVAGGQCVIADATFLDATHRAQIRAAAGASPFLGIWLTAPLDELERRVAARTGDVSDATVAVLRNAVARDGVPQGWRAVDATGQEIALARILDAGKALGVTC